MWFRSSTSPRVSKGAGDMLVKGCLGEAPLQSLRPTSWGMLQKDDGKELCSTCILFIDPCHPKSCDRNNQKSAGASLSSFSEQIWQEEAGRLGFNTVDPEVGTAGMVLVSSIGQLETVCFRVECFFRLLFCRLLFFPAPGVHI